MHKKRLISTIITLIFIGIVALFIFKLYSKTLTVRDKLLKNGYQDIDNNNYSKEVNKTTNYFFNFEFDVKYFIITVNDEHQIYFFEKDQALINECQYDFIDKKALEETACTSFDIKKVNSLKKTFLKELKKTKITLKELKKV